MALVLIVDDSPTEVQVLKSALEEAGYETVAAGSGSEGVDMAVARTPDLILMDVVMPELNGYQATRRLARDERTAGIPIIMVTTKSLETDRIWGLRQGAVEYIIKPFDQADLLGKVEKALAERA